MPGAFVGVGFRGDRPGAAIGRRLHRRVLYRARRPRRARLMVGPAPGVAGWRQAGRAGGNVRLGRHIGGHGQSGVPTPAPAGGLPTTPAAVEVRYGSPACWVAPRPGRPRRWTMSADAASTDGRGAARTAGHQSGYQRPHERGRERVSSLVEVSERLVGSPAFKAGVRCDPS